MRKTDVKIIRNLGKGKSGVSWLVETDEGPAVLKELHDEEVSYYKFEREKILLELEAYERLRKTIVRIPRLLEYGIEEKFLLKEYVDGPTVAELAASGGPGDAVFREIFTWSRRLQREGINIDYFPTNFVVGTGGLYYVDYELNPYSEEWNFENWGIWYWLNTEGMAEFLSTGDHGRINVHGSGKPIVTEELEVRKSLIIRRYA